MSNLDSYRGFAYIYDRLMEDVPYQRWLNYAEKNWAGRPVQVNGKNRGPNHDKPRAVVDLACGTGTITALLAKQGYQVIGIDRSSDMLAVAEEKTRGLPVTLLCQDMRHFQLAAAADAVVCFCDSLNYLLEGEEIRQTFQAVYSQLSEGGAFLFDVHTPYKVTEIFGNQLFTSVDEDISYIWLCRLEEERLTVEHDLTFFVKQENQLFRRYEEIHYQRAYPLNQLADWLRQAGFSHVEMTAEFGEQSVGPMTDRAFFAAYK